jgi:dTDP-glucose pyrophosphorylase/CBS domain-containing protein
MPERFFAPLPDLFVHLETSVRQTMQQIDACASGVALVVDHAQKLIATVTDGDIRRALLHQMELDQPISELLEREKKSAYEAITASEELSRSALRAMMAEMRVQQLPLTDSEGRVVDLALLKDLQIDAQPNMQALIMAGGFGTRLMPLTQDMPKPMLPVGGRPLLEHTVERLMAAGVRQVNVSTHYLAEKITSHFGDGSKFGVEMRYVQENKPMGTGGALALLGDIDKTTLVINGDIVTDLDFRAMAEFHRDNNAAATMAVARYDVTVPYGVVQHDGVDVTRLTEKPVLSQFINAGIYMVEPRVQKYLESDRFFNMTDLIDRLIANGQRVVVFPVREYWIDVGQAADYERVQRDAGMGRLKETNKKAL